MKKHVITFIFTSLLVGCSTHLNPLDLPINLIDIKAQTFTYSDLNEKQNKLWDKARQHILKTYGQSQPVIRVANKENGTLIGKGMISWKILPSSQSDCYSGYDFRLLVRDDKARFQLQLLSGVPTKSNCKNWELPSQYGYKQIIDQFDIMSDKLELALLE